MIKIGNNIKADITTDSGSDVGQYAELQNRVTTALSDLEQFLEENLTWLNKEQADKLGYFETFFKAASTALEFEASGIDGIGPGAGITSPEGDMYQLPPDLPAGWSVPEGGTLRIDDDGTITYAEVETICLSLAGDQYDNVYEVNVRSSGDDLVYDLVRREFDEAGNVTREWTESYVLKNGSVSNTDLVIDATRMGHGVRIDCSMAHRICNGYFGGLPGWPQGFNIHGTEYKDELIGSQGTDKIVGYGDGDYLDGMGGDDKLWGGEVYGIKDYPDTFDPNSTDGDDTIIGGAGNDEVYGGIGTDYGSGEDDPTSELIRDMGGANIDERVIMTEDEIAEGGWLEGDGWDYSVDRDGTIVVRTTGEGYAGSIDMTIPPGFTMAHAEPGTDGSVIVTFTGEIDGVRKSIKVELRDILKSNIGMDPATSVVRVNLYGNELDNLIDCSPLTELENVVWNIYGGDGNDKIYGVSAALLLDDINATNFLQSTYDGNLNDLVGADGKGPFAYGDEDDYVADLSEDGRTIEIEYVADPPVAPDDRELVGIAPPSDDFYRGYITRDPEDHCIVVILMNDEGEKIVYKFVDDPELSTENITVCQRLPESLPGEPGSVDTGRPLELTGIDLTGALYEVNGEAGDDTLHVRPGSNVITNEDENDTVHELDTSADRT